MTDFLFDLPLWFPIVLLAVAVGVFVYGNNRSNARLRLASVGIVALTIGLITLSFLVDTFEEKCVKRTRAVIAAIDGKDWSTVRSLMNAQTNVVGLRGADQIAARGQELAEEFGLRQARILSTTTQPGLPGSIDVVVVIQHEFNVPTPPVSNWVFQYEQRPDGILLGNIAPGERDGTAAEMNKRLVLQ